MKKLAIYLALCVALLVNFGCTKKQEETASSEDMKGVLTLNHNTPSGDLEIFSWWAGDEAPALLALLDVYKEMYPNVNIIDATVAGGSGVNAKAVLKTRMLGGQPPDTFQVHAGQELIGTWVKSDRMVDLTPLFESEGWMDVFPADLLDNIRTDEGIWSVPATVHRSNVLWYNTRMLKSLGIEPPKTWDEFLALVPDLKARGITPLSLGQTWTAVHLWESVALGELGSDKYNMLWTGEVKFNSPEGKAIWEKFAEILKHTNSDAPSLSWQQATDMLVGEEAAFNIMGDWAAGYLLTTLLLEPGVDFGWAPSPSTDGTFMFLADSFGYPIGAPNDAALQAFLKTVGSKEGLDALNPLKGSISPRTDADLNKYNVYQKSAAASFASDKIVGSLAHGVVANEAFMSSFSTVMEQFLTTRDVNQAADSAQAIAEQNNLYSR